MKSTKVIIYLQARRPRRDKPDEAKEYQKPMNQTKTTTQTPFLATEFV